MDTDPWNIVAGINLRHNKPTFGDRFIAATVGKLVEEYAIAIDRGSKASTQSSARRTIEEIDNGKNIAIFPEGTRLTKARIKKDHVLLGEFKNGAFKIAWNRKMCIQPVVLDWPVIWRGKGDDWWGIHPTRIDVHYLEIVDPNDFETCEEFKNACWHAMHAKLKKSKKVRAFLKQL